MPSEAAQIAQAIKILTRAVEALGRESKETNRQLKLIVKELEKDQPTMVFTEDPVLDGEPDAD